MTFENYAWSSLVGVWGSSNIKLVTAGKRCRRALTSRIHGESIYGKLLVLYGDTFFLLRHPDMANVLKTVMLHFFQTNFKYFQALVLRHQLLHYFTHCFHCLLIPFNFSLSSELFCFGCHKEFLLIPAIAVTYWHKLRCLLQS